MYTDEELIEAVKQSDNKAEALRILGRSKSGAAYRWITSKIESLDLNTEHWYAKKQKFREKAPLKDILVENSSFTSSNHLRRKLLEEGVLEYSCAECDISDWNDQPITLQLDHINGINTDNRLENLRLLCPNCHSQTDTWGRKKRQAPLV